MWHLKYLGMRWSKDFNCLDFVEYVLRDHYDILLEDSEPKDIENYLLREGHVVTLENAKSIHVGIYMKNDYILSLRKTNTGSDLISLNDFKNLGFKLRHCYSL